MTGSAQYAVSIPDLTLFMPWTTRFVSSVLKMCGASYIVLVAEKGSLPGTGNV